MQELVTQFNPTLHGMYWQSCCFFLGCMLTKRLIIVSYSLVRSVFIFFTLLLAIFTQQQRNLHYLRSSTYCFLLFPPFPLVKPLIILNIVDKGTLGLFDEYGARFSQPLPQLATQPKEFLSLLQLLALRKKLKE